jgi:hypothetical protein
MIVLERIGWDQVAERSLFVLDAARPDDVPAVLAVEGQFVCLLACDAASMAAREIAKLAARLLAAGCVYICTWGPDCSRVHDIFDEADVARSPEGPWVMSSWHDDDPLDEAIWFLLFNAHPDPTFADGCRSAVGISIGMPTWAATIRTAMQDPRRFSARIVGGG